MKVENRTTVEFTSRTSLKSAMAKMIENLTSDDVIRLEKTKLFDVEYITTHVIPDNRVPTYIVVAHGIVRGY